MPLIAMSASSRTGDKPCPYTAPYKPHQVDWRLPLGVSTEDLLVRAYRFYQRTPTHATNKELKQSWVERTIEIL